MAEKREYGESDRREAVRAVITQGGFREAGRHLNVPWETIAGWKHRYPEWWDKTYAEITLQILAGLTEVSQHKALKLRERLMELIEDRVENGEAKLNVKEGKIVMVPVGLSDLTKTFTALGGQKAETKAAAEMTDEERMLELAKVAQEDRDSRVN
jgi:transposase-like protein